MSSGVSVVCDGSVAGSVPLGFPAAVPLPQPAHQRTLSAPRERAAAGPQSVGPRLPVTSTSCGYTHHLRLRVTAGVTIDCAVYTKLKPLLTIISIDHFLTACSNDLHPKIFFDII